MTKSTQLIGTSNQNFFKNILTTLLLVFIVGLSFGQTNPAAYDLSLGNWTLSGWSTNVPSGSYPGNGATGANATTGVVVGIANGNMAFWRHSGSDPQLTTAPTANFAGDYTAANGKIHGNGTDGIVFNNTSTQGFGSLALALNTTNRSNIQVAWTARQLTTGARTYNLRLMYRIGNTGAFVDASPTISDILFTSSGANGSNSMPTITLPSDANNKPLVQVLWYCYYSGTTTGTRPSMGVDDITVSSTSLIATDPNMSITGTVAHGATCVSTPGTAITYTITNSGTLTANGITVTSSNPDFVVSGLSSTTIAPSGTATYQVTFTPSSSGAKTATITVTSTTSTSNSPTSSLTGTGTATTTPTVTSSAATSITAKTATLNGNVTNVGVCPTIIEKGFVYSISSANATPTDSGTGVTKQVVAGISTGAFTFALTNLASSTQYSFRSYVFNGTTYFYGTVLTFTTSPALVLTGTLAHGSTCPTLSTSPITYTITNNGAIAADGITVTSSNPEFVVSGLSSTTIAPSGTATYQVTFTPASSGSKTANITVASSTAVSATNTVTGTGSTVVAQSIATSTADNIDITSARLRAINVTFGTCSSTTAKGFVYALTTVNNNPEVGQATATNVVVSPLGTAGNFNSTVSGLTSGTSYSYKAYLFNGTSYTYGAVQTFTTASPPTNDNCSGATALVVNAAVTTGDIAFASESIPAIICGVQGNANDDVWYSFTTSAAGNYTISANSGALDLIVDVREGLCNGTTIGCADNTVSGTEAITLSLLANTVYYFRVYDYSATNYFVPTTFTVQVTTTSTLSSNGVSNLSYADQHITSSSASQTFNVSGQFLTGFPGLITLASSSTDFQVSTDNTVWSSSVTVPYATNELVSVPVYVRFTPQSTGSKTGNVTLSGGGATPVVITLSGLGVFTATSATNINATSFDANWQVVTNATNGYLLDVSTSPTFGNLSILLAQGFEGTTFPPTNWANVGWSRSTTAADIKTGSGAAVANSNSGSLTTPSIANPTSMTFFLGRSTNINPKTLTVQVSTTSQTTGFTTVATFDHSNVIENTYSQYTIDLSSYSSEPNVFIRFTKTSSTTSPWRLDDIVVTAGAASFVTGYNAKPISGQTTTTAIVEGLTSETQYFYRLRAVSGSIVSENSNTVSITTLAPITSTTWTITLPATVPAWTNGAPTEFIDAIIDEDYNETAPITAADLTVNTGKVLTIQSANTLSVKGNLTNNGSIVFKSDVNGTAQFGPYTGAAIAGSGTATVERYIPARRAWRILTAPLTGTSNNTVSANWQGTSGEGVLLFSPASLGYTGYVSGGSSPNIRKYDAGWQNITNLTTEPMFGANATDTKAFLVFPTGPSNSTNIVTGADATTLRPKGQLITGTVNHSGLTTNTYHALANPYASPINPTSLIANNPGQKLWLIRSSIGNFGAYVTFDGSNWSVPLPAPVGNEGYIQSGQGFFVRSASATSFTITENDKVSGSSNYWLQKNASTTNDATTADKIRVLLYKQIDNLWNLADGTLTVNYATGSNEVDTMDSNKISNFNESIMFRNGTSSLSIEHRGLPQATDVQNLRMTGTTALPYQLRVRTENYSNSTVVPVLEDTVAGTFTAIPTDGSEIIVPFTGTIATTAQPDNRFRIVYQTNLSTVDNGRLQASVFPNPVTNNQLHVNLANSSTAEYTLTNLLGQTIQKGTLNATQSTIALSSVTQGFYIISIRQEGKVFTTKIYVQ